MMMMMILTVGELKGKNYCPFHTLDSNRSIFHAINYKKFMSNY